LWSPGVGIVTGVDQVLPSLIEKLKASTVSPVIFPVFGLVGACSQTAYRFPFLSMASVGKLPPVLAVGKEPPDGIVPRVATGKSTQFKPLRSLTFGTASPTATGKQRRIAILLKVASSWMT